MRSRRDSTLWCVLVLVLLGGCGDGRTPLLLYSPHGRDLLQLVEDTFEASHPGIDVRWLDMGSQDVYDRVRSEAANPQADVWFGGPDTIFARGAEQGLLSPYEPSWAQTVPPTSRHAEGLYHGLYEAVPILIYNSDAVAREEAPHDWEDLLDPVWTDRIVIRDPLASGTMRTAFGMVIAQSIERTGDEAAGFDWLLRLDAQTREYVVNPALLFEKLIRQEGLVSIWELTDVMLMKQRKTPLDYRFPASGTPVIDDSIGLVEGAPHPREAKEFIDWIGSKEALLLVTREVFRLPARQDFTADELPTWAVEAKRDMVRAEVDWDVMTEMGNEWMSRWDREVRSKGGKE